jgi:hypothetical protein
MARRCVQQDYITGNEIVDGVNIDARDALGALMKFS